MMKYKCALFFLLVLPWHFSALAAGSSPQVNLEVAAESVARVAVYYRNVPLSGNSIDFPLVINGISQHFERVSDFLYVVGNVENADVSFADDAFILNSTRKTGKVIKLSGNFIYQSTSSDAKIPLRVPVLKNISDATISTGFKVHFKSEFLAGNYSMDTYANSFTLLVKPTS